MSFKNNIRGQFEEAKSVLEKILSNDSFVSTIDDAAIAMVDAISNGGKIISCGNGGSMSDAMHFAEELTGRFRENRPSIAAIAISDPSHISCVGNDYGFDFIFSRFVEGVGNKNDVLLAISTSGNSKNVIEACKVAKSKGMTVVALTGNNGGSIAELCDIEIRVPHQGYADRIQEVHIKVIHSLILSIEQGVSHKE